jgi:hypothetical protein
LPFSFSSILWWFHARFSRQLRAMPFSRRYCFHIRRFSPEIFFRRWRWYFHAI